MAITTPDEVFLRTLPYGHVNVITRTCIFPNLLGHHNYIIGPYGSLWE